MALPKAAGFVFFFYFLCINCAPQETFQEEAHDAYRGYIDSFLDYLNSTPDRFYNYNYLRFLNAYKEEVRDAQLITLFF